MVGAGGKTVLVEVKTLVGKRKPRQASYTGLQQGFMSTWLGGPVATVTDVPGALSLLRTLKAGARQEEELCPAGEQCA